MTAAASPLTKETAVRWRAATFANIVLDVEQTSKRGFTTSFAVRAVADMVGAMAERS